MARLGSYQDVSFQKKTRLNGDADAGLAVALNVAAGRRDKMSDDDIIFLVSVVETANAVPLPGGYEPFCSSGVTAWCRKVWKVF